MRPVAPLLALAACWSGSPAAPTEPRPVVAVVRTCAIEPPIHTPQQLRLTRWLGRVGERSWLVARHDQQLQLIGLAERADLPLDQLRGDYIDGMHLWLAGTRDQHPGLWLVGVDLGTALPAALDVIELPDIAPLSTIDALAVDGDRMLLAERGSKVSLQLFDRARKKLGPVTQINSDELLVPELRCHGERCFAVGLEGEAPMRRLYVERFAPDGRAEHEVIADDRVFNFQVAQSGDRTVIVWTTLDVPGLYMRVLDAAGKPIARRAQITGVKLVPRAFEILPAVPPRIAIKDASGTWHVGSLDIGGTRLEEVRTLALPPSTAWFAGAVTPEGILGTGFTSGVDYEAGYHTWTASATATFLPATRDAEPAIEVLPRATGEGRGGMAAFPLIAPGRAGVLVLPQGFETPDGGELIELRRPCR